MYIKTKLDYLFWVGNELILLVPDIFQVCLQAVSSTVQTQTPARIENQFNAVFMF